MELEETSSILVLLFLRVILMTCAEIDIPALTYNKTDVLSACYESSFSILIRLFCILDLTNPFSHGIVFGEESFFWTHDVKPSILTLFANT